MRAPFQVSAIAYRLAEGSPQIEYLILKRSVEQFWQWLQGGGETGEQPLDAIRREAFEEARIPPHTDYVPLQTQGWVPKYHFSAHLEWPREVVVVPIHYFSVQLLTSDVILSHEHTIYRFADYETCTGLLIWDSDRTALWELDTRLQENFIQKE